jgi:mannose-1-phosphate guanylyltransferase
MKAMVLAGGLGTRLRPLTDERPKALVEVRGRTLLEITLTRLREFGIRDVIVNVHHFPGMIAEYLKAHDNFGMRVELSREDELLLDTGGGLKKAGWFFVEDGGGEPFLLHNVDVLSNIDFAEMVKAHERAGALATLAVQRRETSRYLLFDGELRLCGRRIVKTGKDEVVRGGGELDELGFTGIHVISPRVIGMITEQGAFSIIDVYLRLAGAGEVVQGFRADAYLWRDLGKLEQVRAAEEEWGAR